MVIDIYFTNNQNTEEPKIGKYLSKISNLINEMNELPLEQDEILNLSEEEYYEYILKGTEVQKTLFDLFIAEIKTLKSLRE